MKYIYFLLIPILLTNCKWFDDPEPDIVPEIDPEFKAYGDFKTGSYWFDRSCSLGNVQAS